MKTTANVLMGLCFAFEALTPLVAQQQRPITPSDCVTVRYLKSGSSNEPSPLAISPDGRYLAYLVKAPDLRANKNAIQIYLKEIINAHSGLQRLLTKGNFSRLQWLGDSRSLTVLSNEHNVHSVKKIDIETGAADDLLRSQEDVDEYVIDRRGDEVVFVVTVHPKGIQRPITEKDIASGYRIPFGNLTKTGWPRKSLFVTRHEKNGWTKPERIYIESPFNHERLSDFVAYDSTLWLSLSPDGRKLSLQYVDLADNLPKRWQESPVVQYANAIKTQLGQRISVIYDLATQKTTAPFETPFATDIPFWSSDSQAFVVFAKPPVGSGWEKDEAKLGPSVIEHGHTADLFYVRPLDGKIELVATHEEASNAYAPPLNWDEKDGSLLVGDSDGKITRFVHTGEQWKQGQSVKVSSDDQDVESLTSDGTRVFGQTQSATRPPQLFEERLGDENPRVFANLNPQFDALAIAPVKSIDWKTSSGKQVKGTLFLPPDHQEGMRYPLVIQTKPYGNWFACDYGPGHFPSFQPETLASAGIAYLGFYYPDDHDGKGVEGYLPKEYPGGVAEAAFESDVYDTAVSTLSDSGLIDKDRVGIIGFSRSGWYTEFALAHGKTRYRAASVVDNVEYSFTEYAIGSLTGLSSEAITAMYGGPPFGSTLQNWRDYSVSFNVDKIRTPLLMEEMGYGTPFDRRDSPPSNIARTFELFTGLSLSKRPVEYYYYPEEQHQPDHPIARLANLQRNLDWFRFWLEGYERPFPEDSSQNERWRALRELQTKAN